jgi:hypothetical protein
MTPDTVNAPPLVVYWQECRIVSSGTWMEAYYDGKNLAND